MSIITSLSLCIRADEPSSSSSSRNSRSKRALATRTRPLRIEMSGNEPAGGRPCPVAPSGLPAGFAPRPPSGPAQGGNDATFRSLQKWIKNESDVALFKRSETFADLMGFILACNQAGRAPPPPSIHSASPRAYRAVKGVSTLPRPPCSAFAAAFVGLLEGSCVCSAHLASA